MTAGRADDLRHVQLTAVFGAVVACCRQDLGETQAAFADRIGLERSLLARIETGRNTATIEDVAVFDQAFHGPRGDGAFSLTVRCVNEAKRRGIAVLTRRQEAPEGSLPLPRSSLVRLVAVVFESRFAKSIPAR